MLTLRLPSWVDNISRYTNDTLEQIIAIHLESRSHTNEMKKNRAGFLIKEMYDRFKNKSLSLLKPDRSVYIYSAHDTIIVNILNALNLYEVKRFYIDLKTLLKFILFLSATRTAVCVEYIF